MTRRITRRNERGFSLIEVLVAVLIVGITFVVFVGGMGAAIVGSEHHRSQAISQSAIRNFAEAVKTAPFNPDCATAKASYQNSFSPPPPPRQSAASVGAASTSHAAPSLSPQYEQERLLTFIAAAAGTTASFASPSTDRWSVASNGLDGARVTAGFGDRMLLAKAPTGAVPITLGAPAVAITQSVLLPSHTTITWRGRTTAASAGATTLTIEKPAEALAGDALFAQIAVRSAAVAISPPPGWTQVASTTDGSSLTSALFERIASSVGTPTSFVWTFDVSVQAAGGIAGYRGVKQAFTATVREVRPWSDASGAFYVVDADHPCPSAASAALQLVYLEVATVDGNAIQTVQIVKRCNKKPTPTTQCGDI